MDLTAKSINEHSGVLELSGRLNAASSAALKDEVKRQVAEGRKDLVIDLSGTEFIDSSGLSALISGLKLCRESGGSLLICGLTEQTMTVFRVTMLVKVFPIYQTREEALGALRP